MTKQYYAINYTNEYITKTLVDYGWTIKPSEITTYGNPNSYEFRQNPGAKTYVSFYPGTYGPPMLCMRYAGEGDCFLIDLFEAIHENAYFESLEDVMTEVTVKLTNIIYDMVDCDGIDQSDTIEPDDIPTEKTVTIEISVLYEDDEDMVHEAAVEAATEDWLIASVDCEILEDA